MTYFFSVSSAICLSLAWLLPASNYAIILGWLGSLTLIPLIYKLKFKALFLHSFLISSIGTYWLFNTISDFGNFNFLLSSLLFLLFVLSHSLQGPLCLFVFKFLPKGLEKFGLRASLAWVLVSYLPIRIFPWEVSHTQLNFTELIQIADIGGSLFVSLIVLSLSESLTHFFLFKKRSPTLLAPAFLFVLAIIYGNFRVEEFTFTDREKLNVNVVQANINVVEKNNLKLFESNFNKYKILTKLGIDQSVENLIVWPESVYNDWIPENLNDSSKNPLLPKISKSSALIFGALTFRDRETLFNSAVSIYPDSFMPSPNHKKILMPFGEYMPFASLFPFLNKLHPFGLGFSAGKETKLFNIPFQKSKPIVGTLICYEDLVPNMARNIALKGANLIVNLTNDAWFGKTVAPKQHHVIASFRAVENKRTLIRSTNSGFTSIIDPLGRTMSHIPEFAEEILSEKVILINKKTIFTKYIGNFPWFLLLLSFFCILTSKLYRSISR